MKKTLRYLSAFMAILMVMQIFGVSGFAFDSKPLTQNEWQERYDTFITSNTLPLLCVGRDQTELNLTWHAAKESAFPEVKLSENENMEAAVTFTGEKVEAENENQLVCRVTMTGIKENTTYYYSYHGENGWSVPEKYESKGRAFSTKR